MTLDIAKLAVTPTISHDMLRTFWDDAGKRISPT